HAQHMTTHIFLALGLWDEVARQNAIAMQAVTGDSNAMSWTAGHYTRWLQYAGLQQGRWAEARAWLQQLFNNLPADAPLMRARFLYRLSDEFTLMAGYFDQVPANLQTAAMQGPTTIL